MRTTVFGALLLIGLAILMKLQDIADTPAFSAAAVSATARVPITPRAELAPNPVLTPNAETASTVAAVSRPAPAHPFIDAGAAKPAVDAARRAATPRIAATGPAPRADPVIPGRRAAAKALASAIQSPDFQDTVSPLVRLYLAYFERYPDYEGLNYYIGQREGGGRLDAISDEFATSLEIELRYGSLDNAAFVDRIYRNVLDGAGDAQQRASWIAQLDSGAMTRGQVMLAFSESAAFRAATANEVFVSMAYAEILRRSADPAEFSRWVRLLDAGSSRESVIQGLLAKR